MKTGIDELTHRVIGCAMEVHRALGNGFQEVIYQRALAVELDLNKITFAREYEMPVFFKDVQVGSRRVDFLVEECLSVELKALNNLDNANLAQGKNYLEAYNLPTGLLINFGTPSLEFNRLFNNRYKSSPT
ncbi:GxxExxY protein [Spirosoma linguale]